MIPPETIREMLKSATPGPWAFVKQARDGFPTGKVVQDIGDDNPNWPTISERASPQDAILIASAPDLAQTCLELYARVEELEEQLKKALPILQTPSDWNPEIKPNECPIDGSCEACQ